MEQRLINWRTTAMKPVTPGQFLMIMTPFPHFDADGNMTERLGVTDWLITRVDADGAVYGIPAPTFEE